MASDECDQSSANPVVEVAFSLDDPEYPFIAASRSESCTVELVEMIPRSGESYAEFFAVSGGDPDRILALAADNDDLDGSCLSRSSDGGLVEFEVSGNCPARRLAELGALPREVRGVDGHGRIVADIPPGRDSGAILESFMAAVTSAQLQRKRERDSLQPPFSDSAFGQVVENRLTDRQLEVLEAAYRAGYYDWPRRTTGTEVAERLDITSATFSEHIHAAERKLLGLVFQPTL